VQKSIDEFTGDMGKICLMDPHPLEYLSKLGTTWVGAGIRWIAGAGNDGQDHPGEVILAEIMTRFVVTVYDQSIFEG
jgi:hypothetical protein